MKFIAVCFLAFLVGTTHGLINRYVYEFGQDYGYTLKQLEGQIPLFRPVTERNLGLPDYYTITYLRVVVDALSPPKVDFNIDNQVVTISYNWSQISSSSYTILVKGVVN